MNFQKAQSAIVKSLENGEITLSQHDQWMNRLYEIAASRQYTDVMKHRLYEIVATGK